MYKLYVIPGSHACRSAMLMLEHKQVPYERAEIVTLTVYAPPWAPADERVYR